MKIYLITIICLVFVTLSNGQIAVKNGNTANLKSEIALPVKNSPKHDSAMKFTSGVIGSSFYGPEWIGKSKVPAGFRQDYYPIDGYKRTHTGFLMKHYIRRMDGRGDDDVNFYIKPNFNDPHLKKYIGQRKDKNLSDWKQINVEIDVPNTQKKQFFPYLPSMPLVYQTILNAYGPFMHDTGGSHDYIEIHPSEQLWWVNTLNIGLGITDEYNLLLISDDSGRFINKAAQKTPLSGTFAIAFTINPKKERLRYNIEIANQSNVTHRSTDGKKHFYKYNNQNLIEVNEPQGIDILDVSFEEVFIQQNSSRMDTDSLIKGFIVIKSKVGVKTGNYAGNLILKVKSNTLNKNWGYGGLEDSESYAQVKVTLDQIKCIRQNDPNGDEDVYGYVSAGVFDPSYKLPQTLIKPVEAVNPEKANLLWYSLDDTNNKTFNSIINLSRGESKVFNESRLFIVKKTGHIKLLADLNEDDGNTDNNSTNSESDIEKEELFTDPIDTAQQAFTSQNADDMLEKYCKACQKDILVNSLILNQPVKQVFRFGSDGTEIEVHLTVVRQK